MSDNAFRGTLLLLQNRTRRDPESYRDEFLAQLEHFKAASTSVSAQRVANPQYIAVLHYLSHVCHCFSKEATVVAHIVLELLRSSKGNAFPHELCMALVKCAIMLHTKDIITIDDVFPIFFTLLQERDKSLRKIILSHIVTNIRRINMRRTGGNRARGSGNAVQVNRRAQNFLFHVMDEDDAVQARCAEMVLIDLYRRRVWCEERTVEVLTRACFSKHVPILRTALRFFLMQMPKIASMENHDGHDSGGDDDEIDPGRSISKLKQKLKIVKKTAKRERVLERNMRSIKRKYNQAQKEEDAMAKQHVDPIRLLRDPQQFVERLFARLQRTSERFEVRVLYLNVIARTVMEHEIVHLPLYPFLERYLEPSQLHATQLLALSTLCVHRMVPPDAVEPMVRALANHFVSDRSSPDAITIGLNTIREMCKRQPLAMNADLLKDLVEYKNQRGDRGVVMAARALMQLYRDVYPALLPSKLRGTMVHAAASSALSSHPNCSVTSTTVGAGEEATCMVQPVYGADVVYKDIPGLELLYHAIAPAEETRIGGSDAGAMRGRRHTTDGSDSAHGSTTSHGSSRSNRSNSNSSRRSSSRDSHIVIDSDEDESSGEWATDSDESVASDEVEGDYVAVSDAETDEHEEEEEEEEMECPRLVAVPAKTDSHAPGADDVLLRRSIEQADEDEKGDEHRARECAVSPSTRTKKRAKTESSRVEAEPHDDDDDEDGEEDSSDADDVDSDALYEEEDDDEYEEDEEEDEEADAEGEDVSETADNDEGAHVDTAAGVLNGAEGSDVSNATLSKSIADAGTEWFVDLRRSTGGTSHGADRRDDVSITSSKGSSSSCLSVSTMRILTDADFDQIRKLQQQQGCHRSLRGKVKDRAAYSQKRYSLIHGISSDLAAHDIEHFTEKKREEDKLDKIARTESLRKASSKFEIRKKTKSKLNSTHGEHAKQGKLFQMTKRSQRVATKLRSSAADRATRAREMQKKDIKFRIKRGWKA